LGYNFQMSTMVNNKILDNNGITANSIDLSVNKFPAINYDSTFDFLVYQRFWGKYESK